MYGIVGWIFEHPDDPNAAHGHDDHHDGGDDHAELDAGDEQAELDSGDPEEGELVGAGASTMSEETNTEGTEA